MRGGRDGGRRRRGFCLCQQNVSLSVPVSVCPSRSVRVPARPSQISGCSQKKSHCGTELTVLPHSPQPASPPEAAVTGWCWLSDGDYSGDETAARSVRDNNTPQTLCLSYSINRGREKEGSRHSKHFRHLRHFCCVCMCASRLLVRPSRDRIVCFAIAANRSS